MYEHESPTIIKLPQGDVQCFGECREDSTLFACFDNELFDDCITDSFDNWTQAAKTIATWAAERGTTLILLESDY